MQTKNSRLRALIERDIATVVPLVMDALSAMVAESAGFEAGYLGGAALGYSKCFTEANLSLAQISHAALEISSACELPIVLDGQCGWGDPMHMHSSLRTVEAAGASAIEIEDQLMPKRAHHHIGTEHLIPAELMVEKIKVAVAARRDPHFVVIGRTNACRSEGLDEALRRADAYKRAGADLLLVLPKTPEQARTIGERIGGPLFLLMMGGITTQGMSVEEMGGLGYRLVVDGLTPFYARQRALRLAYEALARGEADPTVGEDASDESAKLHEIIGLERMLEIERATVEK